jgi:predicted CXXCH cytochrome family protein
VAPPESTGLRTTHAWIDTLDAGGLVVDAGAPDAPLATMQQGGSYRVWFQVVNGTDTGIDIGPLLETGAGLDATTFVAVPAPDAVTGHPFFVTPAGGVKAVPATVVVPAGSLQLAASVDPAATAVEGLIGDGLNPAGTLRLPAHSFTEVGFTITVTRDAAWSSSHLLRLTDGGVQLSAGVAAVAQLASAATPTLPAGTQGQNVGKAVPFAALAAGPSVMALAGSTVSPHFDLSLTGDTCATCHTAHTAQRAYLNRKPTPISNTCFTCHNASTLPASDVESQYTASPTPSPNVPTTGTYYSHPATTAGSNHSTDREDEFSNRLNRHSECADCHQPHNMDTTPAAQVTSGGAMIGWSASGAIKAASGVSVINGAAEAAPAYTWNQTSVFEYQLCFKCHSGFTKLSAVGARDKGIELNPANGSTHPVEAKGTNATPKMAANLSDSGTTNYKLWNFTPTDTVRCTNCHGNPRTREPSGTPAANANLSPHTSKYEGILLANYKRTLRTSGTNAYSASDFALCYLCHSDRGINGENNYTNFPDHQRHVQGLGGSLNAICSECHYQIHSTALRPTTQTGSTSRLVVFSPNVTASGGVIRYNQTGTGAGNCTLTCHGTSHNPESYP